MNYNWKTGAMLLLIWITIILLACFCTSCRSTNYVEVPTVHTEYVHVTDSCFVRDSIFVHDSTLVVAGPDTVAIHYWHTEFRDRWRDRWHTDTLCVHDTIPMVVTIEKGPNAREKFLMRLGRIFLILMAGAVIFGGFWTWKKFHFR